MAPRTGSRHAFTLGVPDESGRRFSRISGALPPLLRGGPLSKDAVSRLVGRLAEDFKAWSERDLGAEEICYVVQDGWYPKLRIGRQRLVAGAGDAGREVGDVLSFDEGERRP